MDVFLKSNVVFEPLVDRWYAWSHLVSPAAYAMNLLHRHIAIMDSFIMAPSIHAQAVLNPKMRGGPFMDISPDLVNEVEELKDSLLVSCKDLIEFANAIKQLDKLLLAEGKGFGFEELYNKVPGILKGYVELYYDRNHNASFRFFESLLYKSKFYKKNSQSIALWVTENDHRPFALSTPKLKDQNVLNLEIAFDHQAIDELSKMKRVARPYEEIKNLLQIKESDETLFRSFFTEKETPPYQKYNGENMRMRYFGHACILIEVNGLSILVDPLISYYGYHSDLEHFSDLDLPDVIDYVLITHNHQDHILFETLLPLRHKIKTVVVPASNSGRLEDPDLKLMFNNIGFTNVIAINEFESISSLGVSILGLPFIGEHSDLNILTKSCYLVEIKGFKLLFLADSRIVEPQLYSQIHKEIGDVDVMFLGMECDGAPLTWLYGPLMTTKISRDQTTAEGLLGLIVIKE